MSELEELPSWAGRSVSGSPGKEPSKSDGDQEADADTPEASDPESPTAEAESTSAEDASAEGTPAEHTETPGAVADVPDSRSPESQSPESQSGGSQSGGSHEPAITAASAATAATAAVNNSPLEHTTLLDETAAAAPVTQTAYVERRRRPVVMFLLGFLGLCALAGMAALGYFLAQAQNSNETETSAADTTEEAEPVEDVDQDQLGGDGADDQVTEDGETEAGATEASDSGDEATTGEDEADGGQLTVDTDPDDDATAEADGDTAGDGATTEAADGTAVDNDRQAVFRGGKVYLSGSVPSEEVGQFIQQKAEAVVGPGNVVNEYVIDPDVVIPEGSSAPLYVEDVVLFEFNSVEVAQPFLPILDLGTLLLRQNPQASVTVVTRTDAVGSEEANLEVARLRAQAIINYWLGKGVNADQIDAQPLGEEGASEDDDEETAALNRRAEFIITGLLD